MSEERDDQGKWVWAFVLGVIVGALLMGGVGGGLFLTRARLAAERARMMEMEAREEAQRARTEAEQALLAAEEARKKAEPREKGGK